MQRGGKQDKVFAFIKRFMIAKKIKLRGARVDPIYSLWKNILE
jgi:hypothetical protein